MYSERIQRRSPGWAETDKPDILSGKWLVDGPISASELSDKYLGSPIVLLQQHTHYHLAAVGRTSISQGAEPSEELVREFNERADRWESETGIYSSPTRRYLHPDYQTIMTMGPVVIPLILKRLQTQPGDWFWALKHFARKDIAHNVNTFGGAVKAWLKWGADEGYIHSK